MRVLMPRNTRTGNRITRSFHPGPPFARGILKYMHVSSPRGSGTRFCLIDSKCTRTPHDLVPCNWSPTTPAWFYGSSSINQEQMTPCGFPRCLPQGIGTARQRLYQILERRFGISPLVTAPSILQPQHMYTAPNRSAYPWAS